MNTHVVGIRPPDAKWTAMKKVWDACKAAGIDPPDEVDDFFGSVAPDPAGVIVGLDKAPALTAYCSDSESGFEVALAKLPKDVTVIRFFNSW